MKIITKVSVVHDSDILEAAEFVFDGETGNLSVEFYEEGIEDLVLDRLESMVAFVKSNK